MEKYAVFTKSKFVPEYELSISNKIIDKESPLTILEIVRDWIHSFEPEVLVYFQGNVCGIDKFTVMDIHSDRDIKLLIIRKASNVRFQVGMINNVYETRKV